MNSEWYLMRQGKKLGPVSQSQLQRLAQEGRLRTDDLVCQCGAASWMSAGSIPELFNSGLQTSIPTAAAVAPIPVAQSLGIQVASMSPKRGGMPGTLFSVSLGGVVLGAGMVVTGLILLFANNAASNVSQGRDDDPYRNMGGSGGKNQQDDKVAKSGKVVQPSKIEGSSARFTIAEFKDRLKKLEAIPNYGGKAPPAQLTRPGHALSEEALRGQPGLEVKSFKTVFGEPTSEHSLGNDRLLTYKCADGMIHLTIMHGHYYLEGGGVIITDVSYTKF
jgi:hypothetical protein